MWFDSWSSVGRVLAVGSATCVLLVVLLRLSGKRTLSKLNAFDLVVTVAMGSTLSSALLSSDVSFMEAAAAFLALVGLQYVVAKLSAGSSWFGGMVRAEPRLLLENGRFLDDALRHERVTRGEVLSALRSAKLGSLAQAAAVVLETDGSLSVVPTQQDALDVLEGVRR